MRILVIRRDNIGDLVCTTPLLAALRGRFPQARIVALVNSYNAAVLDGNPDVDEVLSYTKLKHRLPGQSRVRILLDRLGMVARLRRDVFDYVLLAKAGFDRQGLSLARQLKRREIAGYAPPEGQPGASTLAVPGQPDPAAQFGSAKPVVWGTYKPYDQVFLPDAQTPQPWRGWLYWSPGRFLRALLPRVQLTRSLEWRMGRPGVQAKEEAVSQKSEPVRMTSGSE